MAKNAQHWEKTRGLLFVTLAIWAAVSYTHLTLPKKRTALVKKETTND